MRITHLNKVWERRGGRACICEGKGIPKKQTDSKAQPGALRRVKETVRARLDGSQAREKGEIKSETQ